MRRFLKLVVGDRDTNLLWVCGWDVFVCGVGGGGEERGSDSGISL